jgi:hypothetical protein
MLLGDPDAEGVGHRRGKPEARREDADAQAGETGPIPEHREIEMAMGTSSTTSSKIPITAPKAMNISTSIEMSSRLWFG